MPPPSSGRGIVLRFATENDEAIGRALRNAAATAEVASAQIVASSNKQAASTAGVERAFAALQRRVDPVARAEQDLARAMDTVSQAQANQIGKTEEQQRVIAVLTRRLEALRQAEASASGAPAGSGQSVAQAAQQQADLVARAQRQMASSAAGTSEAVRRAYEASVAPIDTASAAVRRNYEASVQAGQGARDTLATQLRVKQAYEASLNPTVHLTQATKDHTEQVDKSGKNARQAAYQYQQLTLQLNDVVGGLLSGQRPLQVLVQQGPQVAQAVGGWGVVFRALTGPVGLAVAGIAAVTAAIVSLMARSAELESRSRRTGGLIAAMGGAVGLTIGDIEAATRRQGNAPGFSRADAREAASGLLGNRQVQGADFERLLSVGWEFALLTGKELPDATATMAAAVTGGVAALLRFDEQYNILTVDQRKHIEQLERQGRTQDVVSAGIDAMVGRFRNGNQVLGESQLAWNNASKAAGDFFDTVANSAAAKYATQVIAGLVVGTTTLAKNMLAPSTEDRATLVAKLEAKRTELGNDGLGAMAGTTRRLRDEIAALEVAIDKIDARDASEDIQRLGAAYKALEDQTRKDRKELDDFYKSLVPVSNEFSNLADQIERALRALDGIDDEKTRRALIVLGARREQQFEAADPNMESQREAEAKERVANADRRARAVVEATLAAEKKWNEKSRQMRLGGTEPTEQQRLDFIRDEVRPTLAQIGAQVRDLIEDIDAAAARALKLAAAFGTGLKEGFLAQARTEIAELMRTQNIPESQRGRLVQQKLDTTAADSIQALGFQNATLQPQVQAAQNLAAAEERGAAAVREATIANEVNLKTYEARVRAELSGRPEILAGYRKERDALEANIRAQKEAEAEIEAIRFNRQHDAEATYRAEIDRVMDLASRGKVSARAVADAVEEAEIRKGKASESWLEGARAGLLEYARQARNVGGQVADAFTRGFATIQENFARSMVGMAVDWRQFWQSLKLDGARILVGQMLSPIASGLGGLLGGAGIGGGGTQTITINGQPVTIGGGGVGGGGLSQLLGNLFGGGSGGLGGGSGGFLGGIGAWLNQPLGISLSSGMGPVTADALSGFGSLTGMNVLGGLGGLASGIFGLASGNPIGGIAGLLGGALSFVPGLGGLGSVIGLIGGLLGGVLKKKPKTPQSVSNLEFIDGAWETSTAMTRSKQGSQLAQGTGKAGGAVGDIIDELAAIYGLGLGTGTTGGFLINSIGKNTGNLWQVGLGTYAAPQQLPAGFQNGGSTVTAAYTSAEDAVQALAAMIVRAGAAAGTLTGLTATERTVLRDEDITTIDAIKKALDFSDVYDKLVRGAENITAAETAVEDLNKQFRSLSVQAKSYGLDVAVIEQRRQEAINKLATDVNESSRRRILALTPEGQLQLALEDLDKARDEAIKNALYLNTTVTGTLVDINKLEEAYGKERLEIIENANAAATANLEQIWKRLSYGDLSGASAPAMLAGATATADSLYAQAQAGNLTARADLGDAVNDLFMAQLANTGNNSVYEALRQLWLGRLGEMVSANTDTVSPANGNVDNSLLAQTQAMVDQLGQQVTTLVGTVQDQSREIARLLARL